MPAAFHTFLCRTDNIGVLIYDEATGQAASVDVPEAEAVERALREKNWRLTHIIVTHRHSDHIEGIPALKVKTGARVIAPKKAAAQVPNADELVGGWRQGEDRGARRLGARHTRPLRGPHLLLVAEENALFAGDTIFTLGCGRVSEATPSVLWSSLQRIAGLPNETRIWSGHEYTLSNAKFAIRLTAPMRR